MLHTRNEFWYNRSVLRDSETFIFAILLVYIARFLLLKCVILLSQIALDTFLHLRRDFEVVNKKL
jgi:hypothetical protein